MGNNQLKTTAHATIIACWDALGQARAHISGETPDETSAPLGSTEAAVLEMIDEAIEDCRRTIANGV